jgi:uncharacterized protein YcfJ
MKENLSDTENKDRRSGDARNDNDGHPVATGVGMVGGGAAGAAIGTAVGGPVGTVVGAVIGAVAGAAGGYAVGEAVDPAAEDAYWRDNHDKQPFAKQGAFEDYQPAYRTGYQGYDRFGSESFDKAEPDLRSEYEKSGTNVPWDKARDASKAAWGRVERGDALRVPISEEQVKVGKRKVEQGDAFNEGEIRVPLKKEEAVVQKEARVVGEVRVGKKEETERQNVSETIRKEDVKVDREDKRRDGR